MEIIQILVIIFALFALSRAFLRFKDNRLSKNEFVFWTMVWVIAIIISFIPGILNFSSFFGISRGMDLLFSIGLVVLFYLMFRLYVKLEGLESNVTELVRKFALENKGKKDKKNR